MGAVLGRLAQIISLVVVSQRSLAAQESAAAGDEEETLRLGIRLLRDVYSDIDHVLGERSGGPGDSRRS
jgi:hypothetical protein